MRHYTVSSCHGYVNFYQGTVPYTWCVCIDIKVVLAAAFHQDYLWALARVRGAAKTNCWADRTRMIFNLSLWNCINIRMYWNFSLFLGALLWPGSSWLSCSLLAILSYTVPVNMDRFILFQPRALDIPSFRMTLQNNLQRGIWRLWTECW